MEPFAIGLAGLGAAGVASVGAFGLALRQHRRRLGLQRPRSVPDRLEALAAAQAELGLRLDALAQAAPEEKLQAMAGQLLGLIRDKNATFETALAGLDQLRARMRALEQIGEPAEARALLERLGGRLDELQAAEAARAAALEARLAGLEAPDLAGRLTQLMEAKDVAIAAVLQRLGPLEARLGGVEGGQAPAREALKRLEARLDAEQGPARAERAELRTELGALAQELARLRGQQPAQAEQASRLAALEAGLQAGLEKLAERLEGLRAAQGTAEAALGGRMAVLEDPGRLERLAAAQAGLQGQIDALRDGGPFAEIAEQLTRLYGQKDAAVETVLGRLQPLEAKLAELEQGLADPRALLDRFAERLEAVQGRVAALEGAENPFAEIAEQLTRLYGQKDAAVETVLGRLQPLEAKLAELEAGLAERDPRALLDRFAERLEAVQGRMAALEGAENPFTEISQQLTRLYGQKDAAVETVLGRLQPLEAKLAELDGGLARLAPLAEEDRAAVEGVRARIEALHWAQGEVAAGLAALRAEGSGGFAWLIEAEGRLAPLEARLAAIEARGSGEAAAPTAEQVLDRLARLEAGQRAAAPAAGAAAVAELEAIWALPRIVSLHQK